MSTVHIKNSANDWNKRLSHKHTHTHQQCVRVCLGLSVLIHVQKSLWNQSVLSGPAAPRPVHDGRNERPQHLTHTHTHTHTNPTRFTRACCSHKAQSADMFSPCWGLNGGMRKRRKRKGDWREKRSSGCCAVCWCSRSNTCHHMRQDGDAALPNSSWCRHRNIHSSVAQEEKSYKSGGWKRGLMTDARQVSVRGKTATN